MATLRPDGRWMARKTVDKKPIYGYGRTEAEANADLARKLNPSLCPNPEATLLDFAASVWLPSIEHLEPSTVKRYKGSFKKYIGGQLGRHPVATLDRPHLQRWVNALLEDGAPAPSVRYAKTLLSGILNLAIDLDIISVNPVLRVRLPRPSSKRHRVLSPDQAAALLASISGTRLSAPVYLAVVLGLRRGEAIAFTWSDLDRQRRELRVSKQRKGQSRKDLRTTEPKRGSVRTLNLTEEMIAEIDRRGNLDSPFICTNTIGRQWVPDKLSAAWDTSREKLGLPTWTFHDLRHGCAGLMAAAGMSMAEIMHVLGHTKIDMSFTYTSAGEESSRRGAERLQALLSGHLTTKSVN